MMWHDSDVAHGGKPPAVRNALRSMSSLHAARYDFDGRPITAAI